MAAILSLLQPGAGLPGSGLCTSPALSMAACALGSVTSAAMAWPASRWDTAHERLVAILLSVALLGWLLSDGAGGAGIAARAPFTQGAAHRRVWIRGQLPCGPFASTTNSRADASGRYPACLASC